MGKQHNTIIFKYSTIISFAMERFLDDFAEFVVYDDMGSIFPFTRKYETRFIVNVFNDYIKDFFEKSDLFPYGSMETIVVGSGYSHHNWMYDHRKELTNEKSIKILNSKVPVRYVFSDRAFSCDESYINQLFDVILTNYIKHVDHAYTKNDIHVKWFFTKDLAEDELARILVKENIDAKVFPSNKNNILVDLTPIVYKEIRRKHYIPGDVKDKSLYMYNLLNEKNDNFI